MADRYDPPTGDHAGMVKDECGLFMFVADHDTETAAHLATIERLRGLLGEANAEAAEQAKIVGRLGEQVDRQAAIASKIRAILAEPVREIVEDPFWDTASVRLRVDQWRRLHELLGGDSDG